MSVIQRPAAVLVSCLYSAPKKGTMCISACKMTLLNEANNHCKLIHLAVHWVVVWEYSMLVLDGCPLLWWCNLHADSCFCAYTAVTDQKKTAANKCFFVFLELRLDNHKHKWSVMNENLLKTRNWLMNAWEWPGEPMRVRILLSLIPPYVLSQKWTSIYNMIQNICSTAVSLRGLRRFTIAVHIFELIAHQIIFGWGTGLFFMDHCLHRQLHRFKSHLSRELSKEAAS